MMGRINELLKGSYWRLDLSKVSLSSIELDFLRLFFDIEFENIVDDWSFENKNFLILKKKSKYLPLVN